MIKVNKICIWFLAFFISCVDPYFPPTVPAPHGYLVVDGFADITPEGTHIRLSRTVDVGAPEDPAPPELHAQVSIEGEDGSDIEFEDRGNGIYGVDQLAPDPGMTYRLRIRTSAGKEYLSDYVEWKHTPPIDSLNWEIDEQDRGIRFYVTTHDPDNNTRYYQWENEVTWEYHSDIFTYYEYVKDPSNPDPTYEEAIDNIVLNYNLMIYNCWKTEKSTSIITSSSTRLTNDVIYQFPVHFVPVSSGKLQIGYSVLVKQYGLMEQEFEYLEALKKTTELLGSLTDPQPFKLLGNIRCTNYDEPVLGYFSLRSPQVQRVFISNGGDNLPIWFTLPSWELAKSIPEDQRCSPPPSLRLYVPGLLERGLLYAVSVDPPQFVRAKCIDCRLRGGSNIKPDYWPY